MQLRKDFGVPLVIFYLTLIQSTWAWSWDFGNVGAKLKRDSYNPWCFMNECCNKDWINFKKGRLRGNLTKYVFGQPLLETAVNALSAHFNPHFRSGKALTLSFHGMTGTGKNYVSNFIADSIYTKGSKSKYVHHFIGRMHFSEEKYVEQYRHNLYTGLKGNITDCERQLFIFDEVDKMVPEVLNSIKPMLDHRDDVDGVDYTQSVFVFLSNTGAEVINEHYQDMYIKEGKNRDEMKMSDFETYIQTGAFNEKGWFNKGSGCLSRWARHFLYYVYSVGNMFNFVLQLGGFHHGDVIKNNLIDHYVPFLPLEEKHVIKCIKKEFLIRKVESPKQEHIDEVLEYVDWGPDNTRLFAKTGCRRLGQKVALLVDKHYRHIAFDAKDEL